MKRILLSVFAAAVAAAWSMPAEAADVTFSGQYRLRGEYRNQADFNKNTNDHNDSWGQRVRVTANAKATDDTSIKVTVQDTRTWGEAQFVAGGPSLTDDGSNAIDLHESYVNIDNLLGQPITFRAGRQELVYGDERLIGSFGWSNNGRSFDALKFVYASEPVNVDVFTSKIDDDTVTDNDQDFHGIYATVKVIPNNTLDLYALWLRDGNHGTGATAFGWGGSVGNTAIAGTLNSSQNLYTYGARLKGGMSGIDYTVEIPFQSGSIDTNTNSYDISAWAFAVKAGYTLTAPFKIRVGAEYDYASGDSDNTATNTKIKTFSNLFPTNHDKLGLMDQQGWRNVKAWTINAKADVTEKVSVFAAYWDFSLDKKEDAWYSAAQWNNTPTGIRAASSTNNKTDVGTEIDLVASYKYNSAVTAELGLGRFFTGKFIEDKVAAAGGEKEDQDWAYLQITANF